MSKSDSGEARVAHLARLYPIIHDLEPLLEYEDPFTLAETAVGGTLDKTAEIRGPLRRAVLEGAIKRRDTDSEGRWRYQWVPQARAHLRRYLDGLETLPCDCRIHVPDSRDDPDGVISCKYCGREYPEAFFKQLVRDHL